MSGSENFSRYSSFNGFAENDTNTYIHTVITYSAVNNTITMYRNGIVYGTPYEAPWTPFFC